LPKPLGVMVCNDFRGQRVLNSCQREGIAVPEEVAVIGVAAAICRSAARRISKPGMWPRRLRSGDLLHAISSKQSSAATGSFEKSDS
jgi:hypothetical protein